MDVIVGGRSRKLTQTDSRARNQRRYEEIGPAWYGAPLDKDGWGVRTRKRPKDQRYFIRSTTMLPVIRSLDFRSTRTARQEPSICLLVHRYGPRE